MLVRAPKQIQASCSLTNQKTQESDNCIVKVNKVKEHTEKDFADFFRNEYFLLDSKTPEDFLPFDVELQSIVQKFPENCSLNDSLNNIRNEEYEFKFPVELLPPRYNKVVIEPGTTISEYLRKEVEGEHF
jgi:hypothetical protein